MRHAVRDRVKLHYAKMERQRLETNGEWIEKYSASKAFCASMAPESGRVAAEAYGERLPYIKRLYGATAALAEGDGIWVDAAMTSQPDYKVVAVEKYPQETVALIGKRGAFGG